MPHAALWVVQLLWRLKSFFSTSVSMPHAALWVVQPTTVAGVPHIYVVSMPHAAIPFRPHHRFAVPLPRSRRGGFSFTARRLLFPMRRTKTAAKLRRNVKGYGILASPADAGEVASAASR